MIGAGTMGRGIAQVCASAGIPVAVVDKDPSALRNAVSVVDHSLQRMVNAGRIPTDAVESISERITYVENLAGDHASADVVFEAVPESLPLKLEIFQELDRVCRAEALLATNTSQFPIGALAEVCQRPERVIGMHWFNPAPVMPLVEIVCASSTSEATLQQALQLCERLGKETIVCRKDSQGFITSRLSLALILEAARIVDEGLATAEDVDRACQLAFSHKMGPLATADYSGLDISYDASIAMTSAFGERFRAPQIYADLVRQGHLGRKSGVGFHQYGKEAQ